MADFPELTLNQKLRRIREEVGLTHAQMAEELSVRGWGDATGETIAQFESETGEPTMRAVRAYAELYGMPIDSLTDDEIQPFFPKGVSDA